MDPNYTEASLTIDDLPNKHWISKNKLMEYSTSKIQIFLKIPFPFEGYPSQGQFFL